MTDHSDFPSLSREQQEWLAGHVLGDLSTEESSQAELIFQHTDGPGMVEALEQTAAAVHLALHHAADKSGEMPTAVIDRIRREGFRQVAMQTAVRDRLVLSHSSSSPSLGTSPSGSRPLRETVAWFAAAAAILVAATLWITTPRSATELSLVEQRQRLVSDSAGLLRVSWTPGSTPLEPSVETSDGAIGGDVVWDSMTQTGFMRFVGLPVNDPTAEQYQLWIIDPERDDEPVDGGVFDITENGEVIVPIDAKLKVISPAAFAITIEKPGGVVVSTQDRLPLLAAVQ